MLNSRALVPGIIGIVFFFVLGVFFAEGPAAAIPPSKQPAAMPAGDALPSPLTGDMAVNIGIERNHQVIAGQAGEASAMDSYRSLAAFPNPEFGVTRVQGTSTAPSLTGNTYDTIASVNETLDMSGQRHLQADSAKEQWFANREQLSETKLSLAQQIRDAYWALVGACAQTQFACENLQDTQRMYDLARLQESAGASPRSDVLNSSINLASSQQAYISAQGAEQSALSALNVLLARPPCSQLTPADTLSTTQTAEPTSLPNLPELTRLAQQNRPVIKAACEQVRATEYAVELARAARRPDIALGYERSLEEQVYTVSAGVVLPLLDLGTIKNSIRSADQAKKQAQEQELQAELQVAQQVTQAYIDYTQAQKLLISYQTDILTPSIKLLDMAQLGYKQGATGILSVINAETTLRAARSGYVNNVLALHKGADELLAATGGIPGVITMPTATPQR